MRRSENMKGTVTQQFGDRLLQLYFRKYRVRTSNDSLMLVAFVPNY